LSTTNHKAAPGCSVVHCSSFGKQLLATSICQSCLLVPAPGVEKNLAALAKKCAGTPTDNHQLHASSESAESSSTGQHGVTISTSSTIFLTKLELVAQHAQG
jgi:hypothetical protein